MITTASSVETEVVGIEANYTDALYDVASVAEYFRALDETWRFCIVIGAYRSAEEEFWDAPVGTPASEPLVEMVGQAYNALKWIDEQDLSDPGVARRRAADSRVNRVAADLYCPFVFSRLRIESPMEVVLALPALAAATAGGTAVALHVLRKIMSDSKHIGAWLPGLVAGWRGGWREAEEERQRRKLVQVEGHLLELEIALLLSRTMTSAAPLSLLKPVEIATFGVAPPPPEMAEIEASEDE